MMRLGTSLMVVAALVQLPTHDGNRPARSELVAVANDNRMAAGQRVGDTLQLRLAVTPASWPIFGDSAAPLRVLAFAEEGKAPSIPGPLVRVKVGTPIHAMVRNTLDDTLVLHGMGEPGSLDSLTILPQSTRDIRFVASREGTRQYWATSAAAQRAIPLRIRNGDLAGLFRPREDSQLAGAIVVDALGRVPNDRVFVLTEMAAYPPTAAGGAQAERHGLPAREFTALNGRSWPNTERLQYALGDSVRWRIVNATFQTHPMHLHGFYFRVDGRGSVRTGVDSTYAPEQRRMAVTEPIGMGESIAMVWAPDRPGGWIFHCHLTIHVAKLPPTGDEAAFEFPALHDHGDPDRHVESGMNGMVLGINVVGKETTPSMARPARQLRLFVQSDSAPTDTLRRFGYVLQRGAEPARDSLENPGPVLVLTRGEPTSIQVVNRSSEPAAVHWHGIELDSYYDGAVGWGGLPGRLAPAIRPDSSFDVRITPKRAGTFMYHTHFNELGQQLGGLVGALVVLEPGEKWEPARDLVLLVSDSTAQLPVINGSSAPPTKVLQVGTKYRLRIGDIAVYNQELFVRLRRDSSVVSWRPLAKDGFTLPASQATARPSEFRIASGETADFELTPDMPGELALEIATKFPGPFAKPFRLKVQATMRFRVESGTP
ncbi:MAG: multicopper oxidase domain-containing protein [Gemmatimonadaceae bacterium]